MPGAVLTPVVAYPDIGRAADFLCRAFGFEVRLRIGEHRVQLERSGAWIVVRFADGEDDRASRCSMMVRVENVDAVSERIAQLGGTIIDEPSTRRFGERQARIVDPWGIQWTLSQTVANVAPEEWLTQP